MGRLGGAFGNFEECGYLFYKDNSAVSVEGREALQGEWVEDAEEGRSHRKPQLCIEEVVVYMLSIVYGIVISISCYAAAFFVTYEYVKWILNTDASSYLMPVTHMLAASAGEVVACLIRVPSEVVKQRAQVSASSGTFRIFSNILCQEGIQGLYRGYKSTVLREIPFSLVQFPLWESLKALWSWRQGHVVDCWQSAVCGAFAGGFAAAVTTPLDVAKTRIMLAKAGSSTASGNILSALHAVWRTQGLSGRADAVLQPVGPVSVSVMSVCAAPAGSGLQQ
ncbi:hypothetical protein JEQ12_008332 [Ovis aries]|uniref:Mitochondrial S-adenosylmethionine carrier protein n=1 Tax=Ovis aries TaxID=9940 RepID=A0A836CU46_SHEEP|nr:hypothetical protein JEQ12_008332 [Ovis aries]